jgi:hypothetical protein
MNIQPEKLALILSAGLLTLLALPVQAQSSANGNAQDYDSFRLVLDRNIFDPDRRAPQPRAVFVEEAPPPPAAERITLVGILLDKGEAVAFFAGTRAENNAGLYHNETIAGFTLSILNTEQVLLTTEDEAFELAVGLGLVRYDEGPWELSNEAWSPAVFGSSGSYSADPSEDSSENNGESEATDSASGNALLEKLMKLREKELEE